jgi:hypothetical protein
MATGAQEAGEGNANPPKWTNATKAGPTEIELTFTDNDTIDRSSIAADDFTVSAVNVSNVSVESADDGVSVVLLLENRLDVDTVTVGFTDEGSIADTAGNKLAAGTKNVTGMDTLVPTFERFELTRVSDATAELTVAANEPLTALEIAVTGPVNDRLTMANVSALDDSNTTFRARYAVPEYGNYSFVWERAVDRHGNLRSMSRMRQFRYDDSAPDIVSNGPATTTVGTPVTFSAGETTDEDGIKAFRWRIDGGTVLSGSSVQVAFSTPGRHDITLEVTDKAGHTAVETREIQVRTATDRSVTVTPVNATHANAFVRGTGVIQHVRADNGSLVGTNNVTLERFSGAFPANRSVSLGLWATDSQPPTFEGESFGLFILDHAVPANRVAVTFSVDRNTLNRSGVAPSDVRLYRDAEEWAPLPTAVSSHTDDRVVYRATATGLSQFVVGTGAGEPASDDGSGAVNDTLDSAGTGTDSEPSPRPDIAVTNVTVNATTPSVGETVVISVTVENSGSADGSYPFSVRLNDSSVVTHEIAVAAGSTRTRSYEQTLSAAGELSVAGRPVANVSTSGGDSILPDFLSGLLAGLPNPLALWPDGIVGTILGGVVGFVVIVYSVLKGLAIYLDF